MLGSLGEKSRSWKAKVMAFWASETFCTSTGFKGGVEWILRICCSLGMAQRPQKCNPNKQLNYKDGFDSALIIVPPAREKWRRGESQQTRGSCQLPCSSNWFHERGDECVCLYRMFTDPNEHTVKKMLLTCLAASYSGAVPKSRWPDFAATVLIPWTTRSKNEMEGEKRKKRRGEEVGFVSWPNVDVIISNDFYPSTKLKRGLNLVARFSLMGPLPGLGPGGDHSNFLVSNSFFSLFVFFTSCSLTRNHFFFLPLRTQLPWSYKHLKNPTSTKM